MAKKEKRILSWSEFDATTLPKKVKALYDKMKEQNKIAGEARRTFNDAFETELDAKGMIPDGHHVVVAHNFGKLSVAFDDEPRAKRGEKRAALSF